ncbi:urate hydroxylase PuuD [Aliiruegeria sabulilitoris]|uniref:urate hydroxylase PuuD n=1 Tax=Aliiruegeria sabulilitoris TaxID=1510458 RepID=UPI00082BF4E6|nr:urate hydroxylase PuuD [Aliiruegeria sabulilitoris]NDR58018.1 urate hydroxylase PuuD [Pseudoruegeria sp. M32A2M]
MDMTILWAWAEFAVRWLHVIAAIAWIGSSFFFIALDLGLRKAPGMPPLAHGEEWQVHGGGFYHIQKYLVAPERLPDHLTWHMWESYTTWLSGALMLVLVYYLGADLYLVDPAVLDIPTWLAIVISAASLTIGWLAYDRICKSKFGDDNTKLMLLLYVILVAMAWGYCQIFSGRAALLHLGAFTATIMSANVFFIIIPNQRIVVADLKAGRVPDAKYGKIAKQRSTHNNYLTLPVIFLMLSNHYPLAFASEWNWLIASLVFLMGVTIRHYFNTKHASDHPKKGPLWTWGATALLFAAIVALSMAPLYGEDEGWEEEALSPAQLRYAEAEGFEDAFEVVVNNCSMCHAPEPAWEGIGVPPKGVKLVTQSDVARHAREIYLQAGVTHAMPPGVANYMEAADRAALVRWYRGAREG